MRRFAKVNVNIDNTFICIAQLGVNNKIRLKSGYIEFPWLDSSAEHPCSYVEPGGCHGS